MLQIRPVSDLRNKFPEIEKTIIHGDPVFLTKNGYGAMVIMSLEKYSELTDGIKPTPDKVERPAEAANAKSSHGEAFTRLKGRING